MKIRLSAILITGLLALRTVAADNPKRGGMELPGTYQVSWIGNSFSGKDAWVLQDVEDICVTPDGYLFTNIFWDEAGGNVQEFKDGNLLRVAGHTHGWGYQGGAAVAANAKYLFIVQTVDSEGGGLKGSSWPPKGTVWSGISRRQRTDIRQAAPFPEGRGKEGDVLHGAFLPVVSLPNGKSRALRGVCADEKRLFVSSPFDNTIKVYDVETMQPVRSWPVAQPDKLCLDSAGNVWVLQRAEEAGHWQAQCYTPEGKPLPQRIAFASGVVPTGLCADNRNCLLITDAGPDQQVKIYADSTTKPHLESTFGAKGGLFAAPIGTFGDKRFNQPKGAGVDAAGNIYVASSGSTSGGSTVLECYAPDGQLRWRRLGLTFLDCADADPQNAADVYTKEERFTLDYSQPAGKEWAYRGYTVNPFRYPDDPRLHLPSTNAWVRRIEGRKFLFVTDMTSDYLHVYRFQQDTDGETAIPCALFAKRHANHPGAYPPAQPEKGEWLWLDRNGDGRIEAEEYQTNHGEDSQGIFVPDEQGTIWQVGGNTLRALPVQSLNAKGAPVWDYAKAHTYARPAEFDEVRRLRYLPDKDVMLLGGNKGKDKNQHWKPMGPVLCRYEHWNSGRPVLTRNIVLPYEKGSAGHESVEPISFDVAGDYIFVAYTRGLPSEGLKNAFVKVLRLSDLSTVGNLSAEKVLGETGLLDLVESTRAVRRPNGEYVVFLEDDYKSKIVMFRWKP